MSVLPLMIGMFAIMYFLIIRPQQKQRKDREALLAAVKKGDRVVTSSGIYGTVVGLSEHTVTLKVAEQVKLEFERSAIGRIVPAAGDKESSSLDAPEPRAPHRPRGRGDRPVGLVSLPARKSINLGLDLQGGIHLVLGVDVDKALEAQVERAGDTVRAELEKKGIAVSKIERRGITDLVIQIASPQSWDDGAGDVRARSWAPSTARRPTRPPAGSC